MSPNLRPILAATAAAAALAGCGSSEPEHAVKPLSARPPVQGDFTKLTTPEAKIKFIQDSNAPEAEKQKAIERIKAGTL